MINFLSIGLFALIGSLAGFLAGLLGIGGGIIIVPSLVLVFHLLNFPPAEIVHMAIGTSLASIIITTLVSTLSHQRRKGVMWPIVITLFPGIVLGSMLGGYIANFLSGIFLQIIFGVFIAAVGLLMLRPSKGNKKKWKHPEKALLTWYGLGIGTFASLLGISGGVFAGPLLMGYGHPEKRAVGTASAVGLIITLLGSLSYFYFGRGEVDVRYSLGYLYVPAFISIGIMATIFVPFGVKLAHNLPGAKLRKIFAITLILVGIVMVFN